MSNKTPQARWVELSEQAYAMAATVGLEIGRIHETLSKYPELISEGDEQYMTTALEMLLEGLQALESYQIYAVQDQLWTAAGEEEKNEH